jgi:molybdenum cofactor biosynthesis enzyme MoaA
MKQLKVFFEMINKCNYKCIYCFSPVKYSQTNQILSLETFRYIIDKLRLLKIDLSILLEWWEPLFIDNICEYWFYAKKFVKKVALWTNASLIPKLTKKQINEIKSTFDEVSVWFDTVDEKFFKKLTKVPIYSSIEWIDVLLKNHIPIKLCIVVTKYNTDFSNIIKFCEEKRIKKVRFYWFISRNNNDHSLLPSEQEYDELKKNVDWYKWYVDIKLNRYYKPYTNLVISSYWEISIATDKERKKIENLGEFNNFYNNLESIIK